MIKKFLNKGKKFDNAISETYVYNYMNRVGVFFFWALVFVLIVEAGVIISTRAGLFLKHLSIEKTGRDPSYAAFVKNIIIVNFTSWLIFSIYILSYKLTKYKYKKAVVCIAFTAITSVFVFGLYRFSYLSFMYILPIIITIPLGRKCRLSVFIASLILSALYSVYQQNLQGDDFNWLINTVSLITLVSSYLLCTNVYNAFSKALVDINEYSKEIEKLHNDIAHDFVTGALTKYSLYKDLRHNTEFYSIAFIDLDDFKKINDERGHALGDEILKHLIKCIKSHKEQIYRYGGDEFIVLSKLEPTLLSKKMELIKSYFVNSSQKLYDCDISFSVGITDINLDNTITELIAKCDEVMYISKHNGKNKITLRTKLQ